MKLSNNLWQSLWTGRNSPGLWETISPTVEVLKKQNATAAGHVLLRIRYGSLTGSHNSLTGPGIRKMTGSGICPSG